MLHNGWFWLFLVSVLASPWIGQWVLAIYRRAKLGPTPLFPERDNHD